LELLPSGPSALSGKIHCGDVVTHVDDIKLQNIECDVPRLFLGREGSEVTLTLIKKGFNLSLFLNGLHGNLIQAHLSAAETGLKVNVKLIRGASQNAGVGMKLERFCIAISFRAPLK
jgi:hypothetical protein